MSVRPLAGVSRRPRFAGALHLTAGLLTTAALTAAALTAAERTQPRAEEARALAFLTREVPRWKAENDCYSCHNNGDAARALIVASGRGHDVGPAIDDTLEWLRHPEKWNANKTQGGIDDKPLARVQFAGALRLAVAERKASAVALTAAARLVAADQQADGSWRLDTSQSLGSPTTYGTTLATSAAVSTLRAASQPEFADALARADAWLRTANTASILDAAAVVLGLAGAGDQAAVAQRQRALATIAKGQAPDGGWGPYITVAPEVFDTALVVLALSELRTDPSAAMPAYSADRLARAIAAGRSYLLQSQSSDGSWPETTRPAHQESYAQRISTTGWALLALLATRP